ncbi:DUF932 domain-containing protein [Micromonospora aurantiaca]|uniref:DUF932 domain-containing protein n=1 Tax=Micromonospora aurantiaca (nom. illeg.) TaxID=47850 RepID=UPI003437EC3E
MTTAAISDHLRNSELGTLARALESQRTRSVDLVVPAQQLRVDQGHFVIEGTEPQITEDGVTTADGLYTPTLVGDEGVAAKLDIPVKYLRRLRCEHVDLYDKNVNGWLERSDKSYLLRMLRSDDETRNIVEGTAGVMRAFLSSSYRVIDNFDVLLAALAGLQQAGVATPKISADLTDRRMVVRVQSTDVAARAPELLKDYRSPFTGQTGADNPIVWAGFEIANSETGGGAFTITPRIVVEICTNGMKMTRDAMREVHLGGRMDEGVVRWSEATARKNLELVTSQTADAVATFMDADYVQAKVAELERSAGAKVTDPQQTIATVSKRLGFTQDQQTSILSHFIRGADVSAGGVLHAITATAQTLDDGDAAYDMESKAVAAMELAASIR